MVYDKSSLAAETVVCATHTTILRPFSKLCVVILSELIVVILCTNGLFVFFFFLNCCYQNFLAFVTFPWMSKNWHLWYKFKYITTTIILTNFIITSQRVFIYSITDKLEICPGRLCIAVLLCHFDLEVG